MLFIQVSCFICLFAPNIRASNHWIVTEKGLVRSKEQSPFVLAKSFDLLEFVNQETRWQNIHNIYDDLLMRQMIINSLWSELEDQSHISKHINKNDYCKAVGDMESLDWYESILEDGMNIGITDREFMLHSIENFGDTEVPDCKKISSLTYSMSTFEHLEGMVNRGHLNATPETILPVIFTPERTVNQYGHRISEILRRNTTSWLHYNLAAIYWRIKGNVPKALECSRRAVHHAPRYYKAIPLFCMGSILHRSKKIEDAIVVLGAAVDHNPSYRYSHFTLGKAYALVGDFNNSLKYFNISLRLHHDLDLAKKYYNAVLCHIDMFTMMQHTQRTLTKLSKEVDEFSDMETLWFKIHASVLVNMKHEKEYDYRNVERNCIKIEELSQLKIRELQSDRDRNTLITYIVSDSRYTKYWMNEKGVDALNVAYELERTVRRTSSQTGVPNNIFHSYNNQVPRNKTVILKELGPMRTFSDVFPKRLKISEKIGIKLNKNMNIKMPYQLPDDGENLELDIMKKAEIGKVLYPSNMKVNRNNEEFDAHPDWPSIPFCQKAKLDFPEYLDTLYPVFMPFEHKGISLKKLLTERIGVSELVEHELPWHPPLCPTDRQLSLYTSKKGMRVQMIGEAIATEFLRFKLLAYLSHENIDTIKHKQDAEIGHRIYTAMKKKLASKWVLYTLASLYWRVRGNTANALNCLLTASRTADTRYRDVVLVSLSSVLLEMGLWDESLFAADEAYRMSPYEPPTNFLLAQIHMIKKNTRTLIFHLKQTLRVSPQYMGGHTRRLLHAWACITKQIETLRDLGEKAAELEAEREFCAETEPGHSMVCERDGTNCRVTNRKCQPYHGKDNSALLQMLELRNEYIQEAPATKDTWPSFDTTFSKYMNHVPMSRHDKVGHQKSYDMMLKIYRDMVELCEKRRCGVNIHDLNIKAHECEIDVFTPQYWLHHASFAEELTEPEIEMSIELASITPSHKKIPECKIYPDADEDFFVSRMMAVDTKDWIPILSLMQQFGELHRHYDFGLLGAKLAKYVENKPTSWAGALAAGRWCGAGGQGACATRCLAAAHALLPLHIASVATRQLAALLYMQSKPKDALDIGYLSFYASPKSKVEATVLGILQVLSGNGNEGLWMYRYALTFDADDIVALTCLHIEMCHIVYGKKRMDKNTVEEILTLKKDPLVLLA